MSNLAGRINKVLPDSVIRSAAMASTKIKTNSPHILFAAGVVGFGATVVLASRSTLKINDIVEEHNETRTRIEDAKNDENLKDQYSEQDYRLDKIKLLAQTTYKFGKLYLPAIACGAASLAAFTGAHVIMTNRVAGLAAAYAAVDTAYNKYREKVIEEFGVEKDEEYRFDMTEKETKNAEGKKTKEKVVDGSVTPSMYAKFFDEANPNWKSDAAMNRIFLSHIQNMMNDRLILQGHLLLNDVYDALGYPRTSAGSVVGWVLNRFGGSGDDFVDFGIFGDEYDISKRLFVNGDERSVRLDFNVNGTVWNLINNTSETY